MSKLYVSINAELIGYHRCAAVLKNMYEYPYAVKIMDDSMAPYCVKEDIVIIAPRHYIPPTINNLDHARLYAIRNKIGTHASQIRFCLSKDDVLFIRPANIRYETEVFNISELKHCPIGGVVIAILKIYYTP